MQACVDWVLTIFGTQVIKKKRPVWPVFPDYVSVSYGYGYSIPVSHIKIVCPMLLVISMPVSILQQLLFNTGKH